MKQKVGTLSFVNINNFHKLNWKEKQMMGMNAGMMSGANGASMMLFGWILYIELVILMAYGIAALMKYLQK